MSGLELSELQRAVDEVATSWPDVHGKQVFGHRGWVKGGKMFGFAAEGGIAVRALDGAMSKELYALPGAVAFVYNEGMEMTGWPVLPLADEAQLEQVLSALRRTYEAL